MDRKVILASFIAFCAALGLGRVVFKTDAVQSPSSAPSTATSDASSALTVSSPPSAAEIKAKSEAFDKLVEQLGEKTTLKQGDRCVVNTNDTLVHRVATRYAEGVNTVYPLQFKAAVRWIPQNQEIRRGDAVLHAYAANDCVGKLDREGHDNRFEFTNTYAGTNERFYVRQDGGIEHDIVLDHAPQYLDADDTLIYNGLLQIGDLTLWDNGKKITEHHVTGNRLELKNEFGNTVFVLRQPFAYDANVTTLDGRFDKRKQAGAEMSSFQSSCQYIVDFTKFGVKLGIATSGKWLTSNKRAYPVTIDPNLGAFGLADGSPPVYIGALGTAPLVPAHSGGTRMPIEDNCGTDPNKQNQSYGHIAMPFNFTYYGTTYPAGSFLFVHLDGWAGFDPPYPKYDPLDPNDSPCFDVPNKPIPSPPDPDVYFAPYWADLKFHDLNGTTTNQGQGSTGNSDASGIYYYVDGVAPSRNLNIEWHRMSYLRSTDANQVISFNLILHECDSQITFIIGQQGDQDLGLASVGIQDPSGSVGIQYCYNSSINGQTNTGNNQNTNFNTDPNQVNNNPSLNPNNPSNPSGSNSTIQPGTSLTFQLSPISKIRVLNSALSGCAPLTVCFQAFIDTRVPDCLKVDNQSPVPPGFGFHWTFDDNPQPTGVPGGQGGEAFTANTCHTFSAPGVFSVQLHIQDQFGNVTPYGGTLTVQVCEVPTVVVTATPQGGPAPLDVDFEARTPVDPNLNLTGSVWEIDQLGYNNEPGQFNTVATLGGQPGPITGTGFNSSIAHYRFDVPGLYKTTVTYTALDVGSGLSTSGVGTVFNFVTDPNQAIQDVMIVTKSNFNIDWTGKLPLNAPNDTTTPRNPDDDTLACSGLLNMPNVNLSDVAGHAVRVVVNGVDPVFVGTLDENGAAVQGDASTGNLGNFKLNLPAGTFSMNVKKNLAGSLGLPGLNGATQSSNLNAKNQSKDTARRIATAYHVEIQDLVSSPPVVVTHAYSSHFLNSTLPNLAPTSTNTSTGVGTSTASGTLTVPQGFVGGKGAGVYTLGHAFEFIGKVRGHATDKNGNKNPQLPAKVGAPVAKEELITGGFILTNAVLTLKGKDLFVNVGGLLIRPGGDDFRPSPTSDVVVSLAAQNNPAGVGFSEALNFTTTPTFKVKGDLFTFTRSKGLGATGVASLAWTNGAGGFAFKSFALDNGVVGLDPTLLSQTLVLGFTLTPDSGSTITATTRFTVIKSTDKKGGDVFVKSAGQ